MAFFLVTGGCGFIGSHLCLALQARGDTVRVLDDLSTGRLENLAPGAELICGDVADSSTLQTAMHGAAYKHLPAAVLALAAEGARPEAWNRKNSLGLSLIHI